MNNNNWRELCLQIMIENEDREEFQEFIMSYGNYESDSEDESVFGKYVEFLLNQKFEIIDRYFSNFY